MIKLYFRYIRLNSTTVRISFALFIIIITIIAKTWSLYPFKFGNLSSSSSCSSFTSSSSSSSLSEFRSDGVGVVCLERLGLGGSLIGLGKRKFFPCVSVVSSGL